MREKALLKMSKGGRIWPEITMVKIFTGRVHNFKADANIDLPLPLSLCLSHTPLRNHPAIATGK